MKSKQERAALFAATNGLVVVAAFAALALSPCLASEVTAERSDRVEVHAVADVATETAPTAATQPIADWSGVKRDTLYFLGYQAVVVAVLYALPDEQTRFDKDNAGFNKWRENVTNPVWDEDKFYLNYILHPYWGATYYIRGRERGLTRWQSFGYSALLSSLYEYGAEAFFEPVSYQDLIVTPVIGSLLGELVFSPLRDHIRTRPGGPDRFDHLLLVLTDPMGTVNEMVDRLFGVKTNVSFAPMRLARASGPAGAHRGRGAFSARGGEWTQPDQADPRRLGWGVQIQVRW
ncbi:MAG: DUF3943 domain-containing protein [Burkholderiaceae bacterium]